MGEAARVLARGRSAVMRADHGPVEAGKDMGGACHAVEEPGLAAKLALLLGGMPAQGQFPDQILAVVTKSDLDRNA